MRYYIIIIILFLLTCSSASNIKIKNSNKIDWIDSVLTRDYNGMHDNEIKQELSCYDTAKPKVEITVSEKYKIKVECGLCLRKWTRTYEIEAVKEKREIDIFSKIKYALLGLVSGILIGFLKR